MAVFFFVMIWYVLDDLVAISSNPDSFPNARMIFLFLGLGKLTDMLTSVNTQIISYSKAYRYNLFFLLFLGISNVVLNYVLISRYGLLGAAVATAGSLFLYNLLKLLFIQFRFKMHPFSASTAKTFALLVVFLLLFEIIAIGFHPIINIALKAFVISVLFGTVSFYLLISEDINTIIRNFINKIKKQIWN